MSDYSETGRGADSETSSSDWAGDVAGADCEGSSSGEEGLVSGLRKVAASIGGAAAGLQLPRLESLRWAKESPASEAGDPEVGDPEVGPPPSYEEVRRRVQVDLGCEGNLSAEGLEDPQLAEHMRRAREKRAASEAARAALPRRAALRSEDTAGRRALSSLTAQLKDQQMALQCASDEVHVHAENAGKLASGKQPHGYPPAGSPSAATLEHLNKKLLDTVAQFSDIIAALELFERDLAVARRHYEVVVDGLARWCEHLDEAAERVLD